MKKLVSFKLFESIQSYDFRRISDDEYLFEDEFSNFFKVEFKKIDDDLVEVIYLVKEGGYDRMISFDRRGTNSVITHQRSYRCCSDEFADELANQLNKTNNFFYKKDDTGVYTDSAEFVNQIPECTNISVGYMKEHTFMESQDLFHLGKLAISVLDVDWENLPSKRKAEDKEYLWTEYPQWNQHGYSKKKRNRRSHSKGRYEHPRVFYDNFGQLEEIKTKNNRGIYDPLRDRFLTSELSKREHDIIKYQSMDIENISDRKIYDSLYELLE